MDVGLVEGERIDMKMAPLFGGGLGDGSLYPSFEFRVGDASSDKVILLIKNQRPRPAPEL